MPAELEARLHYPLGQDLPALGHTLEVRPGLRWVRMSLPFALDHINLWLLRDEWEGRPGWTLVDCGIGNAATQAAWEQVLARPELEGLPVLRVLCTHMHPDHVGLAHWMTERFTTPEHDCRLWMSATDWHLARLACQQTSGQGGEAAAAFFARHGLTDPAALAQVRERSGYYRSLVPAVPATYRRLLDGMTLSIGGRHWRCIAGYGHAPEHMALVNEADGVLISGDMVLPRISTNVSVYDQEPEADPLPLYLQSLQRMRADLPDTLLVLPSHGRPFVGLHERVRQLIQHHDERLAEVVQACRDGRPSAAELLMLLFKRPLDLHQTTFAMGEAVAHLHALAGRGLLRGRRDAQGVQRWQAVSAVA